MSGSILIEESPFGWRAAFLSEDGRPERILHRFTTRTSPPFGSLHWGRAGRRDARLGGQRVALGGDIEGILPVRDRQVPEGQMVLVGIRREAVGTKRAVLTDRPTLVLPMATIRVGSDHIDPGPLGRMEPPATVLDALSKADREPGCIGAVPAPVALVAELAQGRAPLAIRTSSGALASLLRPFLPPSIDLEAAEGMATLLTATEDEALLSHVPLSGGGALIIEETEALTAVDIDLGGREGQSRKGAGDALRREAVLALGRALALRGIGGQVVLDFPRSAVRAPKMLREQLSAGLKAAGLVSIPAVTKEGLVIAILGQNRASVLDILTVHGGASVRPGRDLAPDVAARRLFEKTADTLAAQRSARFTLALPKGLAAIFEATGAAAALNATFGGRLTLDQHPSERPILKEETQR